MKKQFISKGAASFVIVAALIFGGTGIVTLAMNIIQAGADQEVVSNTVKNWDGADYVLPEVAVAVEDEYSGPCTMELMPIDLTFSREDIPELLEKLNNSRYLAVYADEEIFLRLTQEAVIQVSYDQGGTWTDQAAASAAAEDFGRWLLQNDPLPGYSMREVQERLQNGAQVKHIIWKEGKEMYFVIDEWGAQIELVQREKLASVLLDGQRLMLTSAQMPYQISRDTLNSFYDLLAACGILSKEEARQDYQERIKRIEKIVRIS